MRVTRFLPLVVAAIVGACDDAIEPQWGRLTIVISTTGGDLDEDGYQLAVDELPAQDVPLGIMQTVELSPGEHAVTLSGVAGNCDVGGGSRQTAVIRAGETSTVSFLINCQVTGVEITVETRGADIDPNGYLMRVVGLRDVTVTDNSVTLMGRLMPGSYQLFLGGLAPNCVLDGGPERSIEVRAREVTRETFVVSCRATTGVLDVSVTSTGEDLDPNGYGVLLNRRALGTAPANGNYRILTEGGSYDVELIGISQNCFAQPPLLATVEVRVGGLTYDTARTHFDIVCERTEKIAFVHSGAIWVAYANNTNAVPVTQGGAPAWSPTGDFLVFENIPCIAGYGPQPTPPPTCVRHGLGIIPATGGDGRALTTSGDDRNPAWSPDGKEIAADRLSALQLIDVQTGARRELQLPVQAMQPAWSPDGTRLAFTCVAAVDNDICVVNRDGTGFARLTSGPEWDSDPAWSPDGTQIAFTTTRFTGREDIAVMNVASGGITRLTQGNSATWSKDGHTLVFAVVGLGLARVFVDGTGFLVLSLGGEYAPVWRW